MWDDRGTGHVTSAYVERLKGPSLLVRSEADGIMLLESRIQPDTSYQKQQETLIVWSEANNYDLALSFQEKAGCDEIWEKICEVQGRDPSLDNTQEYLGDMGDESEDERVEIDIADQPVELPPCELGKLDDILVMFSNDLYYQDKLATAIEMEGYIPKLLQLFRMCEDLENTADLHKLYEIFKNIFLLNKNALFEILFNDENIFDVVGALEYNPYLPQRIKHREFLQKKAVFKEVIPFNNPDLVHKIHQTYRVQYIQEVILPTPSVFEENILSTLNSFVFYNKVEIVGMIQEDTKFLRTLFNEITNDEIDDGKRQDLVMFLKEFVSFSQTLQPRDTFFKTLSQMGILSLLETVLSLDGDQMKLAAIDIFSYIVEFNPSMVRDYIVHQVEGREKEIPEDEELLMNLVIEQMINDPDPELGGAVQLSGILRMLIDPENMSTPGNVISLQKSEFLNFFYKHSMHVLTAPLFANTVDTKPSRDDFQTAQLLFLIVELLTFCIEHHGYLMKNYIIQRDLLRRVLVLLKSKHAFLALSALRMMRRIVHKKDEYYYRYMIKGDLFKPVVEAFKANGNRYNLFNSAIIELFDYLKKEDNMLLIDHFVETYYKNFEHIDYVKTFKELKERYDQKDRYEQQCDPDRDDVSVPLLRFGHRYEEIRRMDEEEELYFDQDELMEDEEDPIIPMSDPLKAGMESEFDQQLNRILESRKAKEAEAREFVVNSRLLNRGTINLQLQKSPPNILLPNSPVTTPASSPTNSPSNSPGLRAPFSSPTEEEKSTSKPVKKFGLVGSLVDYPDEDSSSDEEEEDEMPSNKRLRLST